MAASSDPVIAAILAQRNASDETARELVAAGLAARTGDNATALVIDVIGLPPADHADLAFATAHLPVLPVPKAGATVDGFHLRALLADGRYTRVFEADDTIEKRRVVLKFPKAITGAEGVLRDAFLREAWIAARIRSPWIGETIELPPERQSGLYTAMPFYEGETMERRLSRPPRLSLTAGLDYAIKLAGGVAALHRAGIIHRDIKPDNVILEAIRDHQVPGLRLVDLGVARLPHMEDIPAPYAPGTPSFMAPELFTGAAGDERSDQYALGVTIYRMFTGEYPFGEIEAFSHPRFKRATPLTKYRPDLPAWLDEALARATAVDPQQRFGDVFEFIFALEHGAIRAAPACRATCRSTSATRCWCGRSWPRCWRSRSACRSRSTRRSGRGRRGRGLVRRKGERATRIYGASFRRARQRRTTNPESSCGAMSSGFAGPRQVRPN